MPLPTNVIKSTLSTALKALADKGENIPVDRVVKKLKDRGVRQDELDAAEIPYILREYEGDVVTTRSGNKALPPQALLDLDKNRFDRDLVDTNFKTVEEKSVDQFNQLQMEDVIDTDMFQTSSVNDYVDEDILRELELEQDLLKEIPDETRIRDFFENITPKDVDGSNTEIIIFKDPRDITDELQASKHFEDLGDPLDITRDDYSYHARFVEEPQAINVFEIQSDLGVNKNNPNITLKNSPPDGVPNVNVSQNVINRMIGLAVERNKKQVKFFIGSLKKAIIDEDAALNLDPAAFYYLDEAAENGSTLMRSLSIQKHYSTVVAGQIKRTAEKIGGKAIPDSKGYLILTLPAAAFTLPLYAEEDKKSSFIATATVRGNDPKEAEDYLNNKLPKSRVVRGNFSIGGKVKSKVKSALAALIGRGTKQQLETFIEAVNFNNKLVDKGVLGEDKQLKFAEWELEKNDEGSFVPKKNEQGRSVPKRFLTEEEVRKFDRNDISLGISGDEEAFNAIQHAMLGYDNAYLRTPLIQGREIFSAKNQIVGGRDPNSEHTDRFNNRMGITANREGLSREQFKSRIEDRLGPEGTNLRFKNNTPIERGYDLVTNINDVPPDFISKAMDYITKPELKQDRVERNQGGRILRSLQRNY